MQKLYAHIETFRFLNSDFLTRSGVNINKFGSYTNDYKHSLSIRETSHVEEKTRKQVLEFDSHQVYDGDFYILYKFDSKNSIVTSIKLVTDQLEAHKEFFKHTLKQQDMACKKENTTVIFKKIDNKAISSLCLIDSYGPICYDQVILEKSYLYT